ncbi:YhgE/Pip domain-containing protein [Terrilactibacillus sp. S3-3]|nr:YhgE/Pip domain-containing protein [Terrilactibacillus sp. S3-3]
MVIRIPENFSKNAASLKNNQLKQAKLDYEVNRDYNFVASKISETGMREIKSKVSAEVTKAYVKSMYASLDELTDGLGKAKKGADKLSKGSGKEYHGLKELKSHFKDLAEAEGELQGGSAKLASGASELTSGLQTAAKGSGELYSQTNANSGDIAKLAAGASALAGGTEKLTQNSGQLINGSKLLSSESGKLLDNENGIPALAAGSKQLQSGIDNLESQVKNAQKENPQQLVDGLKKLTQGIEEMKKQTNSSQTASSLTQIEKSIKDNLTSVVTEQAESNGTIVKTIQDDSSLTEEQKNSLLAKVKAAQTTELNRTEEQLTEVQSDLTKIQTQLQEQSSDQVAQLNGGFNSLLTALNGTKDQPGLNSGVSQLVSGQEKLANGVPLLKSGADQLAAGIGQLNAEAPGLVSGINSLSTGIGEYAGGVDQLGKGAESLKNGNEQLNKTWPTLVSGIQTLNNGQKQLASGASQLSGNMNQLTAGLSQLSDGTQQMSNGSGKLMSGAESLSKGNQTLGNNLGDAHSQLADTPTDNGHAKQFAEPVKMVDATHTRVATLGGGFAPYFISLGLFVGALFLTIVYDMGRPAGYPRSGWSIAISKFFVLTIMAVGQALLVDIVALKGLGLAVSSVPVFIFFTILVSMTFMAIIEFLAGSFDNVGRFIAVILLIFQLVTNGGAYAVQLIPSSIQPLSYILPMTYSVGGFRNIIAYGQGGMLIGNSLVLFGFMIVFLLLTIATYTLMFNRRHRVAADAEEHHAAG